MNDDTVVTAYFHASVRGSNGPAGIGAVLRLGETTIHEIAQYIGEWTNMEADYLALLEAVRAAIRLEVNALAIYGSSLVIIQQVTGAYRAKEPRLQSLLVEVQAELGLISSWSISHIGKAANRQAEQLSRQALTACHDQSVAGFLEVVGSPPADGISKPRGGEQ